MDDRDADGRLDAFAIDLNGIARGKWILPPGADQVAASGMAFPVSALALDIWGCDVPAAALSVVAGDPDGLALPVPGTLRPVPWAEAPARQVLLDPVAADGTDLDINPRAVLRRAIAALAALGLTPVVAVELEFYLLSPSDTAAPPDWQSDTLSMDALAAEAPLLEDIVRAAKAQALPVQTVLRENGPGQFEVTLRHAADALQAADQAVLLKRLVRGVARRHGRQASFMAVPFADHAASGQHVHVSLLDHQGAPAFASPTGTELLMHAVGGLLQTMGEAMLLFAPHANSCRRQRLDHLAPSRASWAPDNRTAAIRLIGGAPGAIRLEHRVAGADANPYLLLATVLAGIAHGIDTRADPGPAGQGDLSGAGPNPLPASWEAALAAFQAGTILKPRLGDRTCQVFAAIKAQEQAAIRARALGLEHAAYGTLL